MKVVILAGGKGTRISEYTNVIPKPMVPIGNFPIIWHIMNIYASHGFNEFILALGYKSDVIKDYFIKFNSLNSDLTVNLANGNIQIHQNKSLNWKVTLVDTGEETMTGGRLKRLKHYLDEDTFMLTYGDGLANVNIKKLLDFHLINNKLVTMTAVRPTARFGELELNSNIITSFKEKPQLKDGWINGGFFVMQREFIDFIKGDNEMLERKPLEYVAKNNQLIAFKHEGFWQCMDNKRDLENLQKLWKNNPPWII